MTLYGGAGAGAVAPLAFHRPRRRLEQIRHRRTVAVGPLAVVSVANALALVGSLLNGEERRGTELLLKGFAISGSTVRTEPAAT